MNRIYWMVPALAFWTLAAAGCDGDGTGAAGSRVAIRFAGAGSAGAAASLAPGYSHAGTGDVLTLTGTNGTLRIEDVRMIVSELELEQSDGSCVAEEDGDDHCEEFEAGPFLVDLPLAGGAVTITTDQVAPGTYDELEFEVEDLEAEDDDDPAERQAIQSLLGQLRSVYPAFPAGASMVVHGTFTAAGSTTAQPFTVYFDAEIEVEMELQPPVTVPGVGSLTVHVDAAAWFKPGAQVVNLAALDGRTVEFHSQFRDGIDEVDEIGDE